MYKTLVTDLDGTLLGANHKISDRTKKLLRKLNEKGINIILATGRSYIDAKRIKEELEIDIPLITSNGAELHSKNNELVFKEVMKPNHVDFILNFDYKKYSDKIYMNIICTDKWYVIEEYPKEHKINEWADEGWMYELKTKEDIDLNDTLKFFFSGEHEVLLELEKDIKAVLGDEVNYAFTLPFCLEIFPKGITKANALEIYARNNNLKLEEMVAFGDGYNDVEMLTEVKKGYIMGNAPEKLKKEYSNLEVVASYAEEGLQNKVVEIFEIEE